MKYIYEGHMGGLYCSDYEIEDTYCEQCGDSDWLLGTASSAEDAWELLKDKTATFDSSKCDNCPYMDNYDYCDEHCEDYAHSGGYNLAYVMEFICENFKCRKHVIYMISRAKNYKDYILVNHKVPGHEWGEVHEVISLNVAREEYVNQLSKDMVIVLDNPDMSTIKEIKSFKHGKDIVHIFEVLEDIDTSDEMWNQSAHHMDGGWFGYHNKDDIKLSKAQSFLKEYI